MNSPRSLVLIDPVGECLIKRRNFEHIDYVGLSYLWSNKQGLQLTKANQAQFFRSGSLNKSSRIPVVILDAIELVRYLNPLHMQESPKPEHPDNLA